MKHTGIYRLIMILMFLLVIFTLVQAEETPTVTAMFYETDLRDAIHELSLQTGINIIADQTVSGIITADLKNEPLKRPSQ